MSSSLPAQLAGPGTCAALRPNLPSPVAELCYAGQLRFRGGGRGDCCQCQALVGRGQQERQRPHPRVRDLPLLVWLGPRAVLTCSQPKVARLLHDEGPLHDAGLLLEAGNSRDSAAGWRLFFHLAQRRQPAARALCGAGNGGSQQLTAALKVKFELPLPPSVDPLLPMLLLCC